MTASDRLAHLTAAERAALADYVERLRARFAGRVLQVVLFGSRARGEGDAESDLDVLVVVEDGGYEFHREVALEAFEPSLANDVLITPVIWSRESYERQAKEGLLFFRSLEKDGISLWTGLKRLRPSRKDSRAPGTISR